MYLYICAPTHTHTHICSDNNNNERKSDPFESKKEQNKEGERGHGSDCKEKIEG